MCPQATCCLMGSHHLPWHPDALRVKTTHFPCLIWSLSSCLPPTCALCVPFLSTHSSLLYLGPGGGVGDRNQALQPALLTTLYAQEGTQVSRHGHAHTHTHTHTHTRMAAHSDAHFQQGRDTGPHGERHRCCRYTQVHTRGCVRASVHTHGRAHRTS